MPVIPGEATLRKKGTLWQASCTRGVYDRDRIIYIGLLGFFWTMNSGRERVTSEDVGRIVFVVEAHRRNAVAVCRCVANGEFRVADDDQDRWPSVAEEALRLRPGVPGVYTDGHRADF